VAKRRKRGDRALRTAAGTISYEYQMFCSAFAATSAMSRVQRTPQTEAIRVLTLEAALLHARVLRDFFIGSGSDPDDILVTDFVPRRPRFALPVLRSRQIRSRLNKLLAHPSYSRARLGKQWPIVAIHAEITTAWQLFLDRVADYAPTRRNWFK